eukprot:1689024-Prymnesium_polylepis.1
MLRAASASPSSARRAFLGVEAAHSATCSRVWLLGRCVRLPTPTRVLDHARGAIAPRSSPTRRPDGSDGDESDDDYY